jgi:pimeloyl-ACP methyl ester carboxylesterase
MSQQGTQGALHVERWGRGPRALLVHGGDHGGGAAAFAHQRPLAEHWTLILPDRPGHGSTPAAGRGDFERDAALIAALLKRGDHLVGHSYGGIVALLAAAQRPEAVRSLTLIEPPAFAAAPADPEVRAMSAAVAQAAQEPDPHRRLAVFLGAVGTVPPLSDPLPAPLAHLATELLTVRSPAEAIIPFEALAAAAMPTLLVSGGHKAGFETICDVLAARLTGVHTVLPGHGHAPQHSGAPFNQLLEQFWLRATIHPHATGFGDGWVPPRSSEAAPYR